MAVQLRRRGPAWAAIWAGFGIGFVGIGATMAFPHPWLSPETSVAVASMSFAGAVACFARAAWHGLVGAPIVMGVSYEQFIKTREQLRREAAEGLEATKLRDISQDQRERISERLHRGLLVISLPEHVMSATHHVEKMYIAPLSNGPDTQYVAHVLFEILRFDFSVEILDIADSRVLPYATRDTVGLKLLEPGPSYRNSGPHANELNEHRYRYAKLLVDAFTAEGVVIQRYDQPASRGIDRITILVGRKL